MAKIPERTQERIEEFYLAGLSPAQIVRVLPEKVSYSTVWILTRGKEEGFESTTAYREHQAQQRGFESLTAYQEHQAQQQGFESSTAYEEHLARQRINPETEEPYESRSQLMDYQARQKVNPETGQSFESLTALQQYQAQQRQQKPLNQIVSALITTGLEKIGQSQNWLAEQLGITAGAVSRYVTEKSLPRTSLQPKLFGLLGFPYQTVADIPYKTLDDFVLERASLTSSKI